MNSQPPPNADDYSAATTLIPFPHPLPLLRGPIKAGPSDSPESGPYLLAFKSKRHWSAAYRSCKSLITSQCESGARIGCSISASTKCQPPWWKFLLGLSDKQDLNERAKCEEVEMELCFAAARERCEVFAKEKCGAAFMKARVGLGVSGLGFGGLDWRNEVFGLISGVCFVNKWSCGVGVWGVDKPWEEIRRKYTVTNVRGRDLLGDDIADIEEYLRKES